MAKRRVKLIRAHITGKDKGVVRPPELCRFINKDTTVEEVERMIENLDVSQDQISILNLSQLHSLEVFMGTWPPEERDRTRRNG